MMTPAQRLIRLVALVMVGLGTMLATGGPERVGGLLRWLLSHAGVIIVGVALVGLLHNIAPRGSLVGPALLGALGLVFVMLEEGRPRLGVWSIVGIGVASAGGLMGIQRDAAPPQPDPVRRVVGAVFNREVVYRAGQDAPEWLSVVAVGCRVTVDLVSAGLPRHGLVELNIACVLGHVEIAVPDHWPIVAGRVVSARRLRLRGLLDSTDTFDDPQADDQFEVLVELAGSRRKRSRVRKAGSPVVVHIVGFGGGVTIPDRS